MTSSPSPSPSPSPSTSTSAESRLEAVALVERWLAAFDGGWPAPEQLDELLTEDVRFVERPNLVNPGGSDRDRAAMQAGIDAGRGLLAHQSYEPYDHRVDGDVVVTRMRWRGTLAVDAAAWKAGTRLSAWCVACYTIRDGRIACIDQFDCYEPPRPPAAD